MLALTKWRVELYDMYFKRLNLKVLTFLEFTEDGFFFLSKFSRNLWYWRK